MDDNEDNPAVAVLAGIYGAMFIAGLIFVVGPAATVAIVAAAGAIVGFITHIRIFQQPH